MDVNLDQFIKTIREVEQATIDAIVAGKFKIEELPEQLVTQGVCINAVFKEPECFSKISFRNKDNLVCLAASQLFPNNMMIVPSELAGWISSHIHEPILKLLGGKYKTVFICEKAVLADHHNINHFPSELLDDFDFLSKLVYAKPSILSVIDQKYITDDLCITALQSPEFSLNNLPIEWRKEEYCDRAFSRNYLEIINFPTELITLERVEIALSHCDSKEVRGIVELLPAEQWNEEIIITAVKRDESVFWKVPYTKITTELMFKLAPFLTRYELLHHAPEDVFTENLNHKLVIENPLLLGGIPAEMRNRVLCLDAVSRNGMALAHTPKIVQTEELYHVAVANDGLALQYVPKPYRDENLPMMAVKQNGEAIQYVPSNYIDELMCRTAVMNNPHAIYKLRPEFLTTELYLMALQSLPQVLKLVPVDKRTEELCLIALKQDKEVYDFVPVQLRKEPRIRELAIKYGLVNPTEAEEGTEKLAV
ncbi:DUF4116 domain-containing protein [Acinetobacter radioresistens]|uniref:DUF4116 domain-containing protein n=1 Tax=Acinetobacter radioresistens TaxID=40216 RepID=UPI0020054DD2|nr:DUF4116 domain-containing protein [Acinetobacter radioresistens]MCK4083803.1 DUF4116 domain-containing protein [Acinetobacter radioresistens]